MFKFDPNSSYMMPAHFGPRQFSPKASGWYRDVTAMVVSYLTDPEQLAAYLQHSNRLHLMNLGHKTAADDHRHPAFGDCFDRFKALCVGDNLRLVAIEVQLDQSGCGRIVVGERVKLVPRLASQLGHGGDGLCARRNRSLFVHQID